MSATGLGAHYRDLKRNLAALSPRHQLVFATSCAEVLKPNYERFAGETGWGDAELLERCVKKAWECGVRPGSVSLEASALIDQCTKIAPDTEQFGQASTSAALNAVSAAVSALKVCASPSVVNAVDAATAVIDTVWGYVQVRDNMDPNDPELEQKILREPLMAAELARQTRVLDTLGAIPKLDATTIENIRQSSRPLVVRYDQGA